MKKVIGFVIGGVVGSLLGIGVMSIKNGAKVNEDGTIEAIEGECSEKGEDGKDETQ